jgi:glycosyltransferase involved in cell wall biosynthesis
MVWIVIPAFNEEKIITATVQGLLAQGYENVVVVDDGSFDNTFESAQKTGVHVLQHMINRGQGAALQTGHDYVLLKNAEIVVDFDADGQFDPKDIAFAIEKLKKEKLDVVLGSRFLDNRSNLPFTKKYFILPVAKFVNRFFTGVKLTDVHNGFRIFTRQALEKIEITQDKMAHNTEIVAQIKKNKLRFVEVPVKVFYADYGQSWYGGIEIDL